MEWYLLVWQPERYTSKLHNVGYQLIYKCLKAIHSSTRAGEKDSIGKRLKFCRRKTRVKGSFKWMEFDQIENAMIQSNIDWKFNPQSSSHFGGVWERLFKSIRKWRGTLEKGVLGHYLPFLLILQMKMTNFPLKKGGLSTPCTTPGSATEQIASIKLHFHVQNMNTEHRTQPNN